MKTLAVLLMLVSSAMAQAKVRVYQVSKAAGDPDLMEVFETVAAMEARKIPYVELEVFRKIDNTHFIVWKSGDSSLTYYWLDLPSDLNAADGEKISVRCEISAETKAWNGNTLRILKAPSDKPMTKEEFVALLKAGRTWSLDNFRPGPENWTVKW